MFEIGDAVARKSTGQAGFIHQVRKARATMLLIHWSDGSSGWLPEYEVRPADTQIPPPAKPLTSWGRTTPQYLVDLRKQLRNDTWKKRRIEQIAQQQLADSLAGLSGRKKNKTKMKAAKLIEQYELRQLRERIAREKN